MSFGDHFWALLGLYSTSILTYCLAGMHWVRRLSTRNCLSSSVLLLGCQCGAWFVIALPPPNSVVRESAIVHIYFAVVMYFDCLQNAWLYVLECGGMELSNPLLTFFIFLALLPPCVNPSLPSPLSLNPSLSLPSHWTLPHPLLSLYPGLRYALILSDPFLLV